VTSDPDNRREQYPTGSLPKLSDTGLLLECFDKFAMLSLYPINALFESSYSGMGRIGALINPTEF